MHPVDLLNFRRKHCQNINTLEYTEQETTSVSENKSDHWSTLSWDQWVWIKLHTTRDYRCWTLEWQWVKTPVSRWRSHLKKLPGRSSSQKQLPDRVWTTAPLWSAWKIPVFVPFFQWSAAELRSSQYSNCPSARPEMDKASCMSLGHNALRRSGRTKTKLGIPLPWSWPSAFEASSKTPIRICCWPLIAFGRAETSFFYMCFLFSSKAPIWIPSSQPGKVAGKNTVFFQVYLAPLFFSNAKYIHERWLTQTTWIFVHSPPSWRLGCLNSAVTCRSWDSPLQAHCFLLTITWYLQSASCPESQAALLW